MADKNSARKEYLKLVSAQDAEMPKNETLAEHREHCEAKPGNCPFEKEADKVDEVESAQLNRPHGGVGQGKWRRGVPYQGSKSRIADSIISILPRGKRFVDLFSGGGAVTHSAMLSGKYDSYRMNDIDGGAQDLFVDAVNGKYDNYEDPHYTAEQFAAIKGTPEAYMLSFNGLGRNISKKSLDGRDRTAEQIRRVKELGGLKNEARKIEDSKNDYREVELKEGDVVYADIPYEATDTRGYSKGRRFDKEAFVKWAQEQNVPIYVSEYTMPKGWTEIADFDISGMRGGQRKEKLFVQSRFAENSKRRRSSYVTPAEDAAYADAVKRGDRETALRMIREAAAKAMPNTKVLDKDGLPQVVYHGTYEEFTVFDLDKVGESFPDVDIDHNFFFTASENMAYGYGDYVMPCFLNITRPDIRRVNIDSSKPLHEEHEITEREIHETLIYAHDLASGDIDYEKDEENSDGAIFYGALRDEREIVSNLYKSNEEVKRLNDKIQNLQNERFSILLPTYRKLESEIYTQIDTPSGKKCVEKENVSDKIKKDYHEIQKKLKNAMEMEYNTEREKDAIIRDAIKKHPYKKDYTCTLFNCDNPSQIKSADITYDDAGNLIPLSKRFNFESVDIRDEAIDMQKHDKQFHNGHFDPETQSCSLRDDQAKSDDADTNVSQNDHQHGGLVTPEEDAAYAEAVKRGDNETALRMIREAAAKAMPNTKVVDRDGLPMVVYHGTPDGRFTVFHNNDALVPMERKRYYQNYWFTTSKTGAASYADGSRAFDYQNAEPMIKSVFLNIYNPNEIDAHGKGWDESQEIGHSRNVVEKTIDEGKDGLVIHNVRDTFDGKGVINTFAVFSPSQIKSADITYDDAGNLIPLSKRFNFESVDIRDEAIDMQKHDKQFHNGHFDPETQSCSLRDDQAKSDDTDTNVSQNDHQHGGLVTPEDDAAYADAVKRGDRETALRMIREAAAKAMPNTKVVDRDGLPMVVYHGSYTHGFTIFKRGKEDVGMFFTPQLDAAKDYGMDANPYSVFLNITNPVEIDWMGDTDNDSGDTHAPIMTEAWDARVNGNDGLIALNTFDGANNLDQIVVFNSNQIKSADITYDDEGNLIPLSKRFNFESVDIRDEAIEAEAQDEEFEMVVMSPWQVARAWGSENEGALEERIWRCACNVPPEVKNAERRKFGRELDADELVDMVGAEEFTREDMGEITPASRAWWDKIEDAKVDIEREYFYGADKSKIGKEELTRMLRQRPHKAVEMLVDALEEEGEAATEKRDKALEYLMMAEDSECHAQDPLHCRVHGIRKVTSPLGTRGRVTLTATVGGVNSIPETLTTSAPTFAGAVNNLRFRGANGRRNFMRNVWMKSLQVNGQALPKNVIIDSNVGAKDISLLERRIVSYLYGNPADKAVGTHGGESVRDRVHTPQPQRREGAGRSSTQIPGASDQGRGGGNLHGVSSAGITRPSTPSATPQPSGKLTQGEFAFDAWVDSGTGNMAWKADKRKPRRRPVDKLPKKKVQEIIAENVKLIKTIPEFLHAEVGNKIYKLITDKITPDEFVNWCVDECDVSEGRAYLIACDQVTKAKEQMKLAEWRKQGIEFVMWKHRAGEKEPREYHIRDWDGHSGIRNGKPNGLSGYVFHIDRPPVIDKKTGERGYPSTLIGCKCYLKAIKTK